MPSYWGWGVAAARLCEASNTAATAVAPDVRTPHCRLLPVEQSGPGTALSQAIRAPLSHPHPHAQEDKARAAREEEARRDEEARRAKVVASSASMIKRLHTKRFTQVGRCWWGGGRLVIGGM